MKLWPLSLKKVLPQGRGRNPRPSPRRSAYLAHKEAARLLIATQVSRVACDHGFVYKRIAIKDPRRSWGSCSAKGNLNFSYKLLFLPPCLTEYIVVHELCHLRELNHKAQFWSEVATIMPDYEARLQELRHHERHKGTSRPALLSLQQEHSSRGCLACSAMTACI
jgi:predicted metal-dependent hydrolase